MPLPHYQIPPSPKATVKDLRPAPMIGRAARLDLVFDYRRGRTVLTQAYAEPPFRVGRTLDAGRGAYMILVQSGPGIFGGDRLEQRVRVNRGARVRLVSQAARQVHPSQGDTAVLDATFEVDDDGEIDCFWDPVIPFAGARFRQRIEIQLARSSRLFWSDALMAGRMARGEAWQFAELGHELLLSRAGALDYLERFHLSPATRLVERSWMAGDARYLGTTLVQGQSATRANAEDVQRQLATIGGVLSGVDCVADSLLVGRLLASRGPDFVSARLALREALGFDPPRRL